MTILRFFVYAGLESAAVLDLKHSPIDTGPESFPVLELDGAVQGV